MRRPLKDTIIRSLEAWGNEAFGHLRADILNPRGKPPIQRLVSVVLGFGFRVLGFGFRVEGLIRVQEHF